MLSDDVFRDRLRQTIEAMVAWADGVRDVADIDTEVSSVFWRLGVRPHTRGACEFNLLLKADQRFSIDVAGERYEDKPIDRLDFFPVLARAIEAGRVERVEMRNAATGNVELIETRIVLEDGWAWVGERRVGRQAQAAHRLTGESHIRHAVQYLPYRRP